MKLGSKLGLIFLGACFCLFTVTVQAFSVPTSIGFVNDYAGVLDSQTISNLEDQLKEVVSQKNGVEIAVVTLVDLNGEPIEYVAQQIFDSWRIGKRNSDNGILLLFVINERKVRIHTGYGAEVFLPDSISGDIIRGKIAPQLSQGHYDQGVIAGVDAILARSRTIDQQEISYDKPINFLKSSPGIILFGSILISYLIAFLGRSKAWWPGGLVGAAVGYIFWQITGGIVISLIGFLLDYILSRNYRNWRMEHRTTAWRRTWGGFYNNKPPIGFGGGRSGGGGATGGW